MLALSRCPEPNAEAPGRAPRFPRTDCPLTWLVTPHTSLCVCAQARLFLAQLIPCLDRLIVDISLMLARCCLVFPPVTITGEKAPLLEQKVIYREMYTLHQIMRNSSNITTFISWGHKALHTSQSSFFCVVWSPEHWSGDEAAATSRSHSRPGASHGFPTQLSLSSVNREQQKPVTPPWKWGNTPSGHCKVGATCTSHAWVQHLQQSLKNWATAAMLLWFSVIFQPVLQAVQCHQSTAVSWLVTMFSKIQQA